jgi:hypothetical protein
MDAYAAEAREHGPGLLLTDRQRAWVDAQRLLLRTPIEAPGARAHALPPARRALARLTGSGVFRGGVMVCVVLNTLLMMTQHYSQSPAWDAVRSRRSPLAARRSPLAARRLRPAAAARCPLPAAAPRAGADGLAGAWPDADGTGGLATRNSTPAVPGSLQSMHACRLIIAPPPKQTLLLQALQWGSTAFTVLFCLESLLKLGAQGVRGYFRDPWNVLDFLVSWGSVPSIFITAGPAANVLRTLRIARVLTLLRRVPSVRRLMVTLYLSAPTIGNMLLLILLLIYTFAVLGVNLFYGVQDPNFDKFLNWSNVGSAMMMLSLVASGDWDGWVFGPRFWAAHAPPPPPASAPDRTRCAGLLSVTPSLHPPFRPPLHPPLSRPYLSFMRSTAVAPPFCDPSSPRACSVSPALAQAFFIGFTLLMYVVLLNIVLGVVVEASAGGAGGGGVGQRGCGPHPAPPPRARARRPQAPPPNPTPQAMSMSKGPPDVPPAALARFQRRWARLDPLGRGAVAAEQVGGRGAAPGAPRVRGPSAKGACRDRPCHHAARRARTSFSVRPHRRPRGSRGAKASRGHERRPRRAALGPRHRPPCARPVAPAAPRRSSPRCWPLPTPRSACVAPAWRRRTWWRRCRGSRWTRGGSSTITRCVAPQRSKRARGPLRPCPRPSAPRCPPSSVANARRAPARPAARAGPAGADGARGGHRARRPVTGGPPETQGPDRSAAAARPRLAVSPPLAAAPSGPGRAGRDARPAPGRRHRGEWPSPPTATAALALSAALLYRPLGPARFALARAASAVPSLGRKALFPLFHRRAQLHPLRASKHQPSPRICAAAPLCTPRSAMDWQAQWPTRSQTDAAGPDSAAAPPNTLLGCWSSPTGLVPAARRVNSRRLSTAEP